MKKEHWVLVVLAIFYNLVFDGLSLGRHLSLNSTYLDLGLESQAVWNSSQGRFFETSFGPNGEIISALSYHVTPIILLLTPLYRFFPSPVMLLMLQTLIISLGAVAVYLLAKKILNSLWLALILAAVYLLYPPLEYANLFDFHYVTLSTTFLLFAFYFMIEKRWRLFYLFLILSVSTKENAALVSALMGLYLFLVLKERQRGVLVFLISNLYFLVSVFILMPALGGGGSLGRYEYLFRLGPLEWVGSLFVVEKIKYVFHLLVSVGFLPLLAPFALLPAASEFFLNLFSAHNPQWQVKFHYTAVITPFIFASTIFGASRLISFLNRWRIRCTLLLHSNVVMGGIGFYLILVATLWNVLHSPSPLFNNFDASVYRETKETKEALRVLRSIPPGASVSAMNNLGPHLSNRRFLYRFPIKIFEADYVIVDPSIVGKNYDLSQVTPDAFIDYLKQVEFGGIYKKVFGSTKLLVFKKTT